MYRYCVHLLRCEFRSKACVRLSGEQNQKEFHSSANMSFGEKYLWGNTFRTLQSSKPNLFQQVWPSIPYSPINKFNTLSKCFCSVKIPDFLKEIISTVPYLEEDILKDLDDEEFEHDMEGEIMDFLLSRAVAFDELDGNFIVSCPTCSLVNINKSKEMYIDKSSGFAVCPWCCWDGCWQDVIKFFDSREDCLSKLKLDEFFSNLKNINSSHASLLRSGLLLDLPIQILQDLDVCMTKDNSQLIFRLLGDDAKVVGFANMSLLHPFPKVVQRVLAGECGVFANYSLTECLAPPTKVVIVGSVCDTLHLAKFDIPAICFVCEPNFKILHFALKDVKNVNLWMEGKRPNTNLISYLKLNCNNYSAVGPQHKKTLQGMNFKDIEFAMKNTIPIFSNNIVLFNDLKKKVFERVINKDQITGVKWNRFHELNQLLMGHREGELTVFTGVTGSGKTTFMAEYSLDLCIKGVCTLWGSFEINMTRLCEIMLQQYSGTVLPEDEATFQNLASKFCQLPLYFLNYHGQETVTNVLKAMSEAVLVHGVQHVVIDNLQFMLGLNGATSDWWLEQDRAVTAFRQFATNFNCHVTLIVHPKKVNPGECLSLSSISGGARVTQEADNVLILHTKETALKTQLKTLQVAKNRYGGTLGEIRLRFHKESLTMSSCFRNKPGVVGGEGSSDVPHLLSDIPDLTQSLSLPTQDSDATLPSKVQTDVKGLNSFFR